MRYGSNLHRLTSVTVAWAYIGSMMLSCGPERHRPAEEPPTAPVAAHRQGLKAPPTFTPFRALLPNEALKPSNYSFDVSPSGAARWTMPLWLPAGRNGVQPALALTYNSKGGSSTLGLGFGISGFSAITRCWSTPAQDGRYSGGRTNGVPDGLCLDGQRLVPDGSPHQFRLELDPGTLVRVKGTLPAPDSFEAFEVRYASGRIARYGARDTGSSPSFARVRAKPLKVDGPRDPTNDYALTTDLLTESLASQQLTVSWNIDREEDRFGNYVDYDYSRAVDPTLPGAVEVVPAEIRWTGHLAAGIDIAPSRTLKFLYASAPRLDSRTGFRAGVAVKQSKLLASIEVHAREGLVSDAARLPRLFRKYSFGYLQHTPGKRTVDRLGAVTECVFASATSSQCLDPVKFSWSGTDTPDLPEFLPEVELFAGPGVPDLVQDGSGNRPAYATDVYDSAVGDFDGDGRDDLLYRLPKEELVNNLRSFAVAPGTFFGIGTWFLRLGTPEGLGPRQALAGLPETIGGDWRFSPRIVDLDADGRAEVVLYSEPDPTVPGNSYYDAFGLACSAGGCDFAVKSGFRETTSFAEHSSFPRRSVALQIADLGGDGRADVIRENSAQVPNLGFPTLGWRRGDGSGGFGTPLALTSSSPVGHGNILTRTGDERYVADLDGDGQPELVTRTFRQLAPAPVTFSSIIAAPEPNMTSPPMPTGEVSLVETSLHAMALEPSAIVAAATGVGPPAEGPSQFSRFFMDLNGDGLPDSVAAPTVVRDFLGAGILSSGRVVSSKLFVSVNTGGAFRTPAHTQFPRRSGLNPGMDDTTVAGLRSVDPGARVLDLDGDGREDLLLTSEGRNAPHPTGDPVNRSQVEWLRSTGEGFTGIPLPIPASANFWPQSNGQLGGYGPRMNRVGDFNGDGQPDFVTHRVVQGGLDVLVVHLQKTRVPDVVTSIEGGPHVPAVQVDYGRGSVVNPAVYTRGQCVWPQVCLKSMGWVVSAHRVEATDFESAVPTRNVFQHTYSDARSDVLGRGFLGVARYVRSMRSDGPGSPVLLAEDTLEFDLTSRVCRSEGAVPRCAYTMLGRPSRQVRLVPLESGNANRIETQLRRNMVVDGVLYRAQEETSVVDEREGAGLLPPILRSRRSTSTFDSFGTLTARTSEVSDAALPLSGAAVSGVLRTVRRAVGPSSADLSSWLVARHAQFEVESFDPSLPVADRVAVRTASVTYEPNTLETRSITLEPNAAAETPSTSGLSSTTTLTRDSQGNVFSVVRAGSGEQRSLTIGFSFNDDERIFPSTFINAVGHSEAVYPDAVFGLPRATDDANGIRSSFEYDALGRLSVARPPGAAMVSSTYFSDLDGNGKRLRTARSCTSDAARGLACTTMDPHGRAVKKLSTGFDISVEERFSFNRLGHLTTQALPHDIGSNTPQTFITYGTDALGRTRSRTRPGESAKSQPFTTTFEYLGRSIRETSERGIATTVEYDVKGRLKRQATLEPDTTREVATLYDYWHFDLPRVITHPVLPTAQQMTPSPGALVTTMQYDVLGRRAVLNDPDTGMVLTRYNAFGEAKSEVDANGGTTKYFHDLLGRVERIETPANAAYPSRTGNSWAQLSEFFYDTGPNAIGRLSRATSNDNIETTVKYDPFGRLESTATREGGTSYQFQLSYNANGQLRRLSYPSPGKQQFTVEYGYAGGGEVREVWDVSRPKGQSAALLWRQVSRNAIGLSTEEQFGSSMRTRRFFDAASQLRLVKSEFLANNQSFQTLSYKWEADGLMKSRQDQDLGSSETFSHDFLGRLTKWRVQQNCDATEWTYGYDDWGNMRERKNSLSARGDAASRPSRTYDYTSAADDQRPHAVKRTIEGATTDSYLYNAAGQMTSGRGNEFTWSPLGLPWRVASAAAETKLTYDAFGQRVAQHQLVAGALKRTVTIGGLYELRTSTANLAGEHVYNVFSGDGLVAQVKRGISSASESVRFIHRDAVGSPDAVTGESTDAQGQLSGQLLERGKYEPFGERRHPWALAYPVAQQHTSSAGFTGHEPDDAFGLTNMRGRIYDSHIGRFVSADPVPSGTSQGLNRYSYVGNSPLFRVDPTGFQEQPVATLHQVYKGPEHEEGGPFDFRAPGSAASLGNEGTVPVYGETPATTIPVATPTSDEGTSDHPAGLAQSGNVPTGWPVQVAPALRPQMRVGGACNNGPPLLDLNNFVHPDETARARVMAGVERDKDLAIFAIQVALTLASMGGTLVARAGVEVVAEVGAGVAAKGGVTGFRAVEAAELADIGATGVFRTGPAGEIGKGFFTTESAASIFAKRMTAKGSGPFTTVRTQIPSDVAARSATYAPAGEGNALFIIGEDLQLLRSTAVQHTMAVP